MQAAAQLLNDCGRIVNISSALTHLKFPGATAPWGAKRRWNSTAKAWPRGGSPRNHSQHPCCLGLRIPGVLTEPLSPDGAQMSPTQRLGQPSDIADVVAFLVSEQARWLTGQVIHTGGGLVM